MKEKRKIYVKKRSKVARVVVGAALVTMGAAKVASIAPSKIENGRRAAENAFMSMSKNNVVRRDGTIVMNPKNYEVY